MAASSVMILAALLLMVVALSLALLVALMLLWCLVTCYKQHCSTLSDLDMAKPEDYSTFGMEDSSVTFDANDGKERLSQIRVGSATTFVSKSETENCSASS